MAEKLVPGKKTLGQRAPVAAEEFLDPPDLLDRGSGSQEYPPGDVSEFEELSALGQDRPILFSGYPDDIGRGQPWITIDVQPQGPHIFHDIADVDICNKPGFPEGQIP